MKFLFQIIFIIGFLSAKAFTPLGNPLIETLEINGKEREYVVLKEDAIEYEIEGPKLVKLISRKPVPKKQKDDPIKFSYKIQLDETEHVDQNNDFPYIDKKVKSKKHPAHLYSEVTGIEINIPKGKHILKIDSDDKPLLFRLTKKKKPKRAKSDKYIENLYKNLQVNVITGKRSIPYSKISTKGSAYFKVEVDGFLWLYVRAIHKNNDPGLYPILLSYSNKDPLSSTIIVDPSFLFYSEISEQSNIENSSLFVGKLRTFPIIPRKPFWFAEIIVFNNSEDLDVLIHGELVPFK